VDATAGRVVVAATPIGNADDASPRLRTALATAEVVAAEDTRRLRRLAAALGVRLRGRVVSYYDAVEQRRTPELVAAAQRGGTVLLVTDAGMPLVSDPGHRLVAAAVAAGVEVGVIPGPSAATAAVAVSGLPADRWCVEGFLPRRGAGRRQRLAGLADEPRTVVLFESPQRVAATLTDLAAALGPERRAVLCRELTKAYEEVRRGTLAELAEWAGAGLRGEVTLVVAGAEPADVVPDRAELARQVAAARARGLTGRDAVDAVARSTGLSRRAVYAAATEAGKSVDGAP
jgi:16S rRNA (cytidine1402-2'-O)-methyltransferase